jgi:hypothetical protein
VLVEPGALRDDQCRPSREFVGIGCGVGHSARA